MTEETRYEIRERRWTPGRRKQFRRSTDAAEWRERVASLERQLHEARLKIRQLGGTDILPKPYRLLLNVTENCYDLVSANGKTIARHYFDPDPQIPSGG